jgi:argininosuccinate lyase
MSGKKLWDKGIITDEFIERFTVGRDRDFDLQLAKYDVEGSLAHIKMLESIGLLESDELEILVNELNHIQSEVIDKGAFIIEEGVEDVHSQIELMLVRKHGEVGKKIHSGRSRNDQVLVDLKLFLRSELLELVSLIKKLFDTLLLRSEEHKNVLLPGYTHTQAAMPSSFGIWFAAYAESLVDDLVLMQSVHTIVNRNPLGSAAGYGSSFPLNRSLTTELLNFESPSVNVVYAQMGRGKTEQVFAYALASIAGTLNKLSADICLYNSQNFQFIILPDELTTGSSIMPHKKNPDVFELIRAKTNAILALPNSVSMMISNLTSGYHRDFQILKELLFPQIQELKSCLEISEYAMDKRPATDNILDDSKYDLIFSVEAVNQLVLDGTPFRDAYIQVAEQIEEGTFMPPKEVMHTHLGSIGNLGNEVIKDRMEKLFVTFSGDA